MGRGSKPGTGIRVLVPAPLLSFVVCDLGMSPHLVMGLMVPVFHPAFIVYAALC